MTAIRIKQSERITRLVVVIAVPMLCCTLSLSACGARVARPVAKISSVDAQLDCDHIESEYAVNIRKIEDITGERVEEGVNNLGYMLVDPFFLNFGEAEKIEIEALISRNERLRELGEEKGCGPIMQIPQVEELTDDNEKLGGY